MGRISTCRDVGVDCDFVARGETVEETFRQCARHAKETHGRDEISEEHRVKMHMPSARKERPKRKHPKREKVGMGPLASFSFEEKFGI